MEPNSWQSSVLDAIYTLIQSVFSNSPKSPNNGGAFLDAQENAAASTSTSANVTTLAIVRDQTMATTDALFGKVYWNGKFICYSMENLTHCISLGVYSARLDKSPHLGYVCPHLQVPDRDTLAGGDAG